MTFLGLQFEPHVDAADHQDVPFQLHFAHGFRDQTSVGRGDLTRFQRASKGSGESTRRGGNDVIERRGVFLECAGWNLVVLGD